MRELVADGRATLSDLAASAGLSVSAVQSRVRRFESRGVVAGYTARSRPGGGRSSPVGIRRRSPLSIRLNPMMLPPGCNTSRRSSRVTRWPGEESYVLLVRVETARSARGSAATDSDNGQRQYPKHHHPAILFTAIDSIYRNYYCYHVISFVKLGLSWPHDCSPEPFRPRCANRTRPGP